MSKQELIRKLNLKFMKSEIPDLKVWYSVKVTSKFKEWDKERIQNYEWLIISMNGKSWDLNSTITVRKIWADSIWVERIFPVHSPNIVSIEITKIAKVRRAKLYYMRELQWKAARLKETRTTPAQKAKLVKVLKEPVKKEKSSELVSENNA